MEYPGNQAAVSSIGNSKFLVQLTLPNVPGNEAKANAHLCIPYSDRQTS